LTLGNNNSTYQCQKNDQEEYRHDIAGGAMTPNEVIVANVAVPDAWEGPRKEYVTVLRMDLT
jgi:hypothetical protein